MAFASRGRKVRGAVPSRLCNEARDRSEPYRRVGGSAGGQLVSLLGTTGPSPAWDRGGFAHYSSSVQAVVDMYGVVDLVPLDRGPCSALVVCVNQLIGSPQGLQRASELTAAGPIDRMAPGDPPFLIL